MTLIFPSREGYYIIFEAVVSEGSSEIHITQVLQRYAQTVELKFAVFEYKSLNEEMQTSVWQTAPAQLREYLGETTAYSDRRQFAAISVGKKVQFYEYDRNAGTLAAAHEGILLVGRQCQTVQSYLDEMKET